MTDHRSHHAVALSAIGLLAGFGSFWFADTVVDPDLWGHIRFGQDILRTGSIIQTDIYSYRTLGQRWVNHEWLAEVIFAAIYVPCGPTGLIVVKVAISLAIIGLGYGHLRRRSLGPYRSALLLALIAIPFRMGLGTIRPQIFTYLLFLLELLLLDQAERGRERRLWVLPILFGLWVNLHGGVLAGVGILLIWFVGRIGRHLRAGSGKREGSANSLLHGGLIMIASCLALLLNPYRAELVGFLLRTAAAPRPEISEWAPMMLRSLPGLLYLALLVTGTAALASSGRHRPLGLLSIFAATAVLTLISNRHYPLFALALVVVAGEHLADVSNRYRFPAWSGVGSSRWLAASCILASVVLIGLSGGRLGCIRIEPFYFPFPARAVAFLKACGIEGNMAVPFDWGEYVIWHLGPRVKVSIDGRRETVYSELSYRQSLDFAHGTGDWDALLKTTPTDLVLARNGSPPATLMSEAHGWLPLYRDSFCILFARADFPLVRHFADVSVPVVPDDGAGLCFPSQGGTPVGGKR
jgi:hypothetical protein